MEKPSLQEFQRLLGLSLKKCKDKNIYVPRLSNTEVPTRPSKHQFRWLMPLTEKKKSSTRVHLVYKNTLQREQKHRDSRYILASSSPLCCTSFWWVSHTKHYHKVRCDVNIVNIIYKKFLWVKTLSSVYKQEYINQSWSIILFSRMTCKKKTQYRGKGWVL